MQARLSSRLTLLIVATMFLLPLVLAWLMITGVVQLGPMATRNAGRLVQPPVPVAVEELRSELGADPLPTAQLEGRWLLLYVLPRPCETACITVVTGLRQVHRATGRHQPRIRILLLGYGRDAAVLSDIYDSFVLVRDPTGDLTKSLQTIVEAQQPGADVAGSAFLVDPLGSVMLYYPAGSDLNGLKQDLQRLMEWSKQDQPARSVP
jgi:hypothetical protein